MQNEDIDNGRSDIVRSLTHPATVAAVISVLIVSGFVYLVVTGQPVNDDLSLLIAAIFGLYIQTPTRP